MTDATTTGAPVGDRSTDDLVDTTAPAETAEANRGHDAHGDDHDHPSDMRYIGIAVILAVLTALEIVVAEIDLGPAKLPILLGLMVVKFFVVVSYFMHLKFDNRIFTWLFYTGLILAVLVYIAALTTFRFFNS